MCDSRTDGCCVLLPRYGFGIAVCSLALVTVVLVVVGIVMGVFGFRRDVRPYKRTGLSHCGGIFLLM